MSFKRATDLQPDYALAWFNQGSALQHVGYHEAAFTCYQRVTDLQPTDARAWVNKGISLCSLGRYDEGLASYSRAIQEQPDNPLVWLETGFTLGRLGRLGEALSAFEREIKLRPENTFAWFNKGQVLSRLGRSQDALDAFEHCVSDLRTDPTKLNAAVMTLGEALKTSIEAGDLHRAEGYWQALLEITAPLENSQRQWTLASALIVIVRAGGIELARRLISQSDLEDMAFPLIPALDYAATGDRALIEKLPPELGSLVEEIVASLPERKPTPPDAGSPKRKKPKRRSLTRTRKKLS